MFGCAAWRYEITGRGGFVVPVLLLDTDLPDNDPIDRGLCGQLYGGDDSMLELGPLAL